MFELLLQGGWIIDGEKTPRYQADVGIKNGRIHTIGNLGEETAVRTINATGKIVAPGFIDVHAHSDGWLLKTDHLESKTRQGFTTELIMADGLSYAPLSPDMAYEWLYYQKPLNALDFADYTGWRSLAEYMALLDKANVQNAIPHIPYANLRIMAGGYGRYPLDDYQTRHIIAEVEKGMSAGAVGLSTGLDYVTQCFATTDEIIAACKPMAGMGGVYVSHIRYKKGIVPALKEAVEIGKQAGVPVHISHLKAPTATEADAILHYINHVAINEVDFSFDVYPYLSSSTMLNYLLPYSVWEKGPLNVLSQLRLPAVQTQFAENLALGADVHLARIAWVKSKANAIYQGLTLAEFGEAMGLPVAQALLNLLIEENLAVLLVFHQTDDALVYPFLQHERFMLGTDGIYHQEGMIHPRQYGSVGRLLGRYVRDERLFDLETAVSKLTSIPAKRFGLKERGVLKEGNIADIVVFDADTINDQATNENPHQFTVGIEHVLVNGTPIILDEEVVELSKDQLPGRALKFSRF